jgi:hypothetical protein
MNDEKPPNPATKPSMPKQPETTKLPAMTDRALLEDLARVVKDGFREQSVRADAQDERLDKIERQVDIAVQDGRENNKRITTLEVRFEEKDRRDDTRSVRVRQESDVNLKQDAAIANVITRLGTVEENQTKAAEERASTAAMVKEVRDTVVGVATNKKVVFIGKVLFGIAVAYSAAHGLKVLP